MNKCVIENCALCNSDMATVFFDDSCIKKSCRNCNHFTFTIINNKFTQLHIYFKNYLNTTYSYDLHMRDSDNNFYMVYNSIDDNTRAFIKTVYIHNYIDKLFLNKDIKLQCECLLNKLIKIGEIYA